MYDNESLCIMLYLGVGVLINFINILDLNMYGWEGIKLKRKLFYIIPIIVFMPSALFVFGATVLMIAIDRFMKWIND